MNNEIDKSIIKKFRKEIWSKFIKAVIDYKLINENDNIMVCISGGKDSFLLAKCIQELERHGKYKFKTHYVVMNPGYKKENLDLIKENAKLMNIDIEIFDANIFNYLDTLNNKPCYLCARMRRGALYSKAKELNCNKIALGHHFNDVIETTLLSMMYTGEIKTMLPKLHSENFEGLELIRPLYYVKESDIIKFKEYHKLKFLNCACKVTKNEVDSKRKEVKKLIESLKETNPYIEENIFNSMNNINMHCILGYKENDVKHSFLDNYDEVNK